MAGIVHQVIMSCIKNRESQGYSKWHSNNIIVGGNLKKTHLLLFLIGCCCFLTVSTAKLMTVYFSQMSGTNVGIITTMWCTDALFSAILEWLIFG